MFVTFETAMKDAEKLIVSPNSKNPNKGFFTNNRVDRRTLPDDWYAYDIRSGGRRDTFQTLENLVAVNHAGTFLTKTPIKMNKQGFHSLAHGAGYTFA